MPLDAKAYLADVLVAADRISTFISNRLVWEIAEGKLRGLRATVASLLDGA